MTITTLKWTIVAYHRLMAAGILDDHRVELLNRDIVEMSPEAIPPVSSIKEAADYLRDLLGRVPDFESKIQLRCSTTQS